MDDEIKMEKFYKKKKWYTLRAPSKFVVMMGCDARNNPLLNGTYSCYPTLRSPASQYY